MTGRERRVRVRVLGSCRLEVDGIAATISPSQRRLVSRLAVSAGRPVGLSALYEALWVDDPPSTARAVLHNQVSRLRAIAGREVIITVADGYQLTAPTDVDDLRAALMEGEHALRNDPATALTAAERGLALAGGAPFSDLGDAEVGLQICHEVEELIAATADLKVMAALALGSGGRALSTARRSVAAAPHDEGRAARLAQALVLVGRRGEALAEIARVRRALRTDLGLHGSNELDRIESQIRGGATLVSDPTAERRDVASVFAAVERGGPVVVVGDPDSVVTRALAGVRDELLGRGSGAVAMIRVQGYRDVAVAALLDLLDLLGVDPVPALGPVGTFVPAVAGLAQRQPVVLLVEQFDAAGPTTRRVLLEAAQIEKVTLVAGARTAPPEGFAQTIALIDPHDDRRTGDLRRRFAALPQIQRDALTAVAVAGDAVPRWALQTLGVTGGVDGAIDGSLLIVTPVGGVEFRDGALREVVLADTPSGVCEELHHALGHVLAARGSRPDAARHLLAAATIEPLAAVAAARAAAAEATASGAHHDTIAWLEQAMPHCHDDREQIALQIALGDALRLAGDPSHVEVLLAAADRAERRHDDELLGEAAFALLALGGTSVSTATHPQAEALLTRAIAQIQDESLVALVKAAGSLAYSMTGSAERSRRLFLDADAVATPPAVRMRVLPFTYMSLGLPGDLADRRLRTEELLALGATHSDPVATYEGLHLAFTVHLQDGDGSRLRHVHAEMTTLVDRVGDVGRRWALHYMTAALAHLDGEIPRSERLSQEAFSHFAPVSQSRATAVLFGQIFGLRLVEGTVAELQPALERLVADQPGVPAWTAAYALSLATVDPLRAISVAGQAMEIVQPDFTWLVAHLVGARAVAFAVQAGAPDDGLLEAYRVCLQPWSGRVSWQGTCTYGPVDTTLALIASTSGDAAEARRLAEAARQQCRRLGAPVFSAELTRLGLD